MKLISYRHAGVESFGRLVGDAVVDCSVLKPGYRSIRDVLERGALPLLRAETENLAPTLALSEVELLPVITDPGKILCAGLNYRSHRTEAGREPTARPTIFLRVADSQIGADQVVTIPPAVAKFDYEGELAVIIGKTGTAIGLEDAMSFVAGYACYNDFSARDWQQHTGQWTPGKNFTGTGAFGPAMVTADEIADHTQLTIETRVNGEVRQSARLGELLFSIPELIAYVTSFTTLRPGDVIVTGTPGGVGLFREPPEFLTGGEKVEVEISQVGILRTQVEAMTPAALS